MTDQYLLLIEVDGKTYEAFDTVKSCAWASFVPIHPDFMMKIQEKIIRREPFAVHYVDDLEEFERQFREETT